MTLGRKLLKAEGRKTGTGAGVAATPADSRAEGRWTRLALGLCALHLFTLSALAIAKPLFDITAKDAAFYVMQGYEPSDIIALILILCAAVPAVLVLCEVMAGLAGSRLHRFVHFFFAGVLLALYGAHFVKGLAWADGYAAVALIAGAGAGGLFLYVRTKSFRRVVSLASPAVILIPLVFVFGSPVGKIIFPAKEAGEKGGDTPALTFKQKPPIVFIVFDEFPLVSLLDVNGAVDAKRFPNFAAFARTSYWFPRATSVADATAQAVPAILTGKHPAGKGSLPTLADHPDNLFTLLRNEYKFHVWETGTHLCPPELAGRREKRLLFFERMRNLLDDLSLVYLHAVLPAEYTRELPAVDKQWGNFRKRDSRNGAANNAKKTKVLRWNEIRNDIHDVKAGDRIDPFRDYYRAITGGSPELHFMHLMLPHGPFEYLPSGKNYEAKSESGLPGLSIKDDVIRGPQGLVDKYHQLHLLQVGAADALLGELLQHLRSERIFDESLIVLVADHGISFIANDHCRELSASNAGDIMFVPMFLKLPGQETGVTNGMPAETVDILPTVGDALGVKIPWAMTGKSLLAAAPPVPRAKRFYSKGSARTIENEHLERVRAEALSRNAKAFSLGDNGSDLYWYGSDRKYLGNSVANYKIVNSPIKAEIEQDISILRNLRSDNDFLPAAIDGKVLFDSKADIRSKIAVAINGIICDVGDIYKVRGEYLFSLVMPEKMFKEGKNEVGLYIIKNNEFHKLIIEGMLQEVTYRTEKHKVIGSDGAVIAIVPQGVVGSVDEIRHDGKGFIRLAGWSANLKESRLSDLVLFFENGNFIRAEVPREKRKDVADSLKKPKMTKCGFDIIIPAESIRSSNNLEVYGVSGKVASLLTNKFFSDEVSLSFEMKKDRLVASDGKTTSIVPMKVVGLVDAVVKDSQVVISGWAADVRAGRKADYAVLFDGDRFVKAKVLKMESPEVSKFFNNENLSDSGYQITLPLDLIKSPDRLRVFGISGDFASEISRPSATTSRH